MAASLSFTRFERARILGARALQIAMGAPPLLTSDRADALSLAQAEFENGLIPMTTHRVLHARD